MKRLSAAALGFALLGAPAFADGHATGDPEAGEKVFAKCRTCHAIIDADGEVIRKGMATGPNLYGLYTRTAGTYPEFEYGDSIVEAGEAGLVWDEAHFVEYVADPRKFLRAYLDDRRAKSNMTFKLRGEEDAKNLWAYIVSVGPEVVADEEAEATN